MTATAERLEKLDREVEDLKNGFVEVISELQKVHEDDTSFSDRWQCINVRLRQLRYDLKPEDFDKDQVLAISKTLLDIYELAERRDSLDALDQLLINFERMRHVVRDALDEHVNGVAGSTAEVLNELYARLPDVPQHEVASLVGVDRRTLLRWRDSPREPTDRLRVIAQLVAILRHNWENEGVVAWFHRPRRELDGKTPLKMLEQSHIDEEVVISAARAGRSQYGS
jgi:uncharacterized protein (DUF2384 family)